MAPNLTMHISRGEFAALERLFKSVALRSTVATALPSFVIVLLVVLGTHYEIEAVNRIVSATTLFWIACAATSNTAIYTVSVYLRAHREEPMLPVSVVSALLSFAVILAFKDDINYMMFGYTAISFCVSLPLTLSLYRRYSARHCPLPSS